MNKTIKQFPLIFFYVKYNTKQRKSAYISKYNHDHDNQANLLMITDDGENLHYVVVKSIFSLFRGTASNNNRDYYCLNCFHSYRTKHILKKKDYVVNMITVM